MKKQKVKFIAIGAKWFDKVNGNTYHSVRITRCSDAQTIVVPFQYGYGDHYRQTALEAMFEAKWIPKRYGVKHESGCDNLCMFERENNYPIQWEVTEGLKRDCVANGVL